jgi:dephospho-CoA kinase
MRRILLTGMSGTGKSTVLAELAKQGFQVVETDDAPWSEWSEADGGYVRREDLVAELLSRNEGELRSTSPGPSRIRVASTRDLTRWSS